MRFWHVAVIVAIFMALNKTVTIASDRVKRVAEAIAVAEGYGVPGAIPTVRNNPGNIRSTTGPVATYPTPEAGWTALYNQVQRMLDGTSPYYPKHYTLTEVARVYTGEAAYMNWANNLSRILGVPTDIRFSEIA